MSSREASFFTEETSLSEHPNVQLLRTGFDAFATGDMATLDALFGDDVVWHVAGRSPVTGEFKGKEQVFGRLFAGLAERSGGTFRVTVEFLVADDDHVAAMVRHQASRDGRNLAVRACDFFTVRDGRVVEVWSSSFDPYENDEFWA